MVYNLRSVTAFWVYVRNCLLKGRFWKSLRYAVANYVETYGTKAYTVDGIHHMFSIYKELQLVKVSQVITWCDRAMNSSSVIVTMINKLLILLRGGDKVGCFLLIKAVKI